jgi:predicted metal-dependent enzyme (double-stranded beta helix superfamily)
MSRSANAFDLHAFVAACEAALATPDPAAQVTALLEAALADPDALAVALAQTGGKPGLHALARSESLTVAHVISAPHTLSPVHNHCMWGVIGIYAGQEDNHLYRRGADGLIPDGVRSLRRGDVFRMPVDLIHAVANPLDMPNAGLHIYGGDLVARPGRSLWDPDTRAEGAYSFERVLEYTARLAH